MKTASAVSAGLHGAFLLWAVLSFGSKPFEVTPAESLPVDLINIEDFQKLTKGIKDAPKKEEPAPLVEKIEPPKPVEEQKPKVTEKKELKTEQQAAPPPPPQQQDAIAEQIKKTEQPKEAKVEPKPPVPPKKPEKQQPKFDANKIAALLDKRDPTRNAAADMAPANNAPALGANSGSDKRLSMTELAAFKERLKQCWSPPVGADHNAKVYVVLQSHVQQERHGNARSKSYRSDGFEFRSRACRQRAACAVAVPAVHDAQARILRHVERH